MHCLDSLLDKIEKKGKYKKKAYYYCLVKCGLTQNDLLLSEIF